MSPAHPTYELLALDASENCDNAPALLHLVRGNSKLWKNPKVSETECRITDGRYSLSVAAIEQATDPDSTLHDELGRAYILTLSGPYDDIEPLREPLLLFLKKQQFKPLYVLRDQVSEHIACELYPHLYRIENLLRGYLIRFMATHIGPKWWELTVTAEMRDKTKMRTKNERVFSQYIENSAYLIDFGELGEIVYEHSSGFRTREDIVKRISSLAETPEAIHALKQELQSNYYKLFKEFFADRNFKDKWTQFEVIRNKIAHNNLFTADDLAIGESLATEITEIISAADAKASRLVITNEEREAIRDQVIARSAAGEEISEDAFLSELAAEERFYASKTNGFVGLGRFLSSHLGTKGYSYESTHEMVDRLEKSGVVEIYQAPNLPDQDRPVTAIRKVVR